MSEKFVFASSGQAMDYPIMILAYRGGTLIKNIPVITDLRFSNSLSDPSEFSFTVNKSTCDIWGKIRDDRLIWLPEWNDWFILKVNLSEDDTTTKTITATHLPEKELSTIKVYGMEVGTEDEIERKDYDADHPTIFWNVEDSEHSLLHRLFKGAPNYKVIHVDHSLVDQRGIYSFDGTSIYDAVQEIAEDINCQFVFDSYRDDKGHIVKTVAVYDLEQYCEDCHYRSEFEGTCPECGSTNVTTGYGEDTTIFLSRDNFVNDNSYSTNLDEISTCFKLETGDEDMTQAVVMCNPNGTPFIWRIADYFREDMSPELKAKLNSYETDYASYVKTYDPKLDLTAYNMLVKKYSVWNKDLKEITSVKGYTQLAEVYYSLLDLEVYLTDGLYPTNKTSDTTAEKEGMKLTTASLSPVAVENYATISNASADSAVLSMAKILIDSRYKISVGNSSFTKGEKTSTWTGTFQLENYSDEDDAYLTNDITVEVNEDIETFVKQKIDKTLKKGDTENYSVSSLFKKELPDFTTALKQYGATHLDKFWDEAEGCMKVLQEKGLGDPATWENNNGILNDAGLYKGYRDRQAAIETEQGVREAEVKSLTDLLSKIKNIQTEVQKKLNIESYLGTDLWNELLMFRKDDTYSNSNYISDGLNTAEVFEKAKEFYEKAEKEIKRASEIQHNIDSTLKHLLTIDACKPLLEHFKLGNWLRIQVDDEIFKLRLIGYEIPYDSYDSMDVTFSDAKVVHNDITDVRSALQDLKTITTSYGNTQKQAERGSDSKGIVDGWSQNGLDTTLTKIMNSADSQDIIYDKNGILLRSYDEVQQRYGDRQMKLINSTIAFTDDSWETVKTAIGRFYYIDPVDGVMKDAYGVNGEVIVGRLILGENLGIYNTSGSLKFDGNGFSVKMAGDTAPSMSFGVNGLIIDNTNQIRINGGGLTIQDGNVSVTGKITATTLSATQSGEIGCWKIDKERMYDNTNLAGYTGVNKYGSGQAFWAGGTDLTGGSAPFHVDHSGKMVATNATITGEITSTKATLNSATIVNSINIKNEAANIEFPILNAVQGLGYNNVVHFGSQSLLDFLTISAGATLINGNTTIAGEDLTIQPQNTLEIKPSSDGMSSPELNIQMPTTILNTGASTNCLVFGSDNTSYTLFNNFGTFLLLEGNNVSDTTSPIVQLSRDEYGFFKTVFNSEVRVQNQFWFYDWSGTNRRPVASFTGDGDDGGGARVAAFGSNKKNQISVKAQFGRSSFDDVRYITTTTSDIRLKKNVSSSDVSAIPLIRKIPVRQFDWKLDSRHQSIGFIADELEKLDPNLVMGGGYDDDGTMNVKCIDDFYLLGYLTKAIQELSAEVESLKARLHE